MKYRTLILLCVFLSLFGSLTYAAGESFHSLPTRDEVEQPLWLEEPDNPSHIIIIFAGGNGLLKITENGIRKKNGNFQVRTRDMFVDQGMAVVVVDTPDDQKNLYRFRKTSEHAQDIKAVMDFMRKRLPGKPLWLVGTSRGTLSVANTAARIHGKETPNGIVMTSSVTIQSNRGLDSLDDIDLSAITAPTLIVHHEDDGCYVTPYDDAELLLPSLISVKTKAFMPFRGGETEGNPCKGKSYHGFLGIEKQVMTSIIDWVKAH